MRKRTGTILLALLALVPAACAPLPDLSGYTASTSSVRQAVKAAGSAVSSEADYAEPLLVTADAKLLLQTRRQAFDAAWKKNVTALDAMVRYAQSIEAISAAGNDGAKSAGRVADQLQALIGSLGIPIAPAAGIAVEVGEKLYAQLALVRAAKSLKDSLKAADPAIRELAPILASNVDDAERAFLALSRLESSTLEAAGPGGFGDFTALADALAERQKQLATQLSAAVTAGDESKARGLRTELETLAASRASIAPQLADYADRTGAIAARKRAGQQLFGASRDALAAWSEAHAELVTAVNDRRPVTLESLQNAVADIRDLIKQWRAL